MISARTMILLFAVGLVFAAIAYLDGRDHDFSPQAAGQPTANSVDSNEPATGSKELLPKVKATRANGSRLNQEFPALAKPVDPVTEARLEPWFQKYRDGIRVRDPIERYVFVELDQTLVSNIEWDTIDRFHIRLDDEYFADVVVDVVRDYTGGHAINGYIPERKDMSEAIILVGDGGLIQGSVLMMGLGTLMIVPIENTPYHVVYLSTGSVNFD